MEVADDPKATKRSRVGPGERGQEIAYLPFLICGDDSQVDVLGRADPMGETGERQRVASGCATLQQPQDLDLPDDTCSRTRCLAYAARR